MLDFAQFVERESRGLVAAVTGIVGDYRAFTYWPDRKLAMWGLTGVRFHPAPVRGRRLPGHHEDALGVVAMDP